MRKKGVDLMEFVMFWEAILIAAAVSLDAFAASFAYGGKRIQIPILSVLVISFVCAASLGISLFAGEFVGTYIPEQLTILISFGILFCLGIWKLFDNGEMKNFDSDDSKIISLGEATALAVALSLDGLAVGFGAALGSVNSVAVILSTFVIGAAAVMLGGFLGLKIAGKLRVSWISGVLLILLAFAQLI